MRLAEIRRFPVKSMLGEAPSAAEVGAGGLLGDRSHAVVDLETGKIASAKRPRLWGQLLEMSARYLERAGPGEPLTVSRPDGAALQSREADFDERLSAVVGRPVRLMTAPEPGAGYEHEWAAVEGTAPDDLIDSTRTSTTDDGSTISTFAVGLMAPGTFQDVAPVAIMTTATLRRAAELQPASRWDPRRFRPNLLVEVDGSGFVENNWGGCRLAVGEVVLAITVPTPRCVMTTLAQEDLGPDREILRTVARHNRLDVAGTGVYACLGMYANVVQAGHIAVGDEVELL